MPRQIRTLGQARDAGLHLIAICHNILCRARLKLNLIAVIEFAGEGSTSRSSTLTAGDAARCDEVKRPPSTVPRRLRAGDPRHRAC